MPCTLCDLNVPTDENGMCEACRLKLAKVAAASGSAVDALKRAQATSLAQGGPVDPPSQHMATVVLVFDRGGEAKLKTPFSVAIEPSSNVLVMDRPGREAYRISRFGPDGKYIENVVICNKGAAPSQLRYPKGVTVGPDGTIFIPDGGNDRIQRFLPDGTGLGPIGTSGNGPGELDFPCDVDVDDTGLLYVADTGNCRIQKLTPQGLPLMTAGGESDGEADGVQFAEPLGVTVGPQRCVYVADTNNHRVVKLDVEGQAVLSFGDEGDGPGMFRSPSDIRVEADGAILVADRDNSRVQKFSPDGSFLAQFMVDVGADTGGGDIAVDGEGCLLICDQLANNVVKVRLIDVPSAPDGNST